MSIAKYKNDPRIAWTRLYGKEKASEMWKARNARLSIKMSGKGHPQYGRRGKDCHNFKDGLTREQRKENIAGRKKPDYCEVCGELETATKRGSKKELTRRLCFDHDHNTGNFRGWICNRCNTILGYAKDTPDVLRKLADYLEKKNE